jgi:hypothetical protein
MVSASVANWHKDDNISRLSSFIIENIVVFADFSDLSNDSESPDRMNTFLE